VKNHVTREIRALAGKYNLRAVKQVWKLAREAKNQDTQSKALELLLAYGHGKPQAIQLIGGSGDPVRTQHIDTRIGRDQELGRQPGTPSPNSYYTPPKGAKPAELRAWMLQQSDALETLVRMARA
jgi:hypothetical protein